MQRCRSLIHTSILAAVVVLGMLGLDVGASAQVVGARLALSSAHRGSLAPGERAFLRPWGRRAGLGAQGPCSAYGSPAGRCHERGYRSRPRRPARRPGRFPYGALPTRRARPRRAARHLRRAASSRRVCGRCSRLAALPIPASAWCRARWRGGCFSPTFTMGARPSAPACWSATRSSPPTVRRSIGLPHSPTKQARPVRLEVRRVEDGPTFPVEVIAERIQPNEFFLDAMRASVRVIEREGRRWGYVRIRSYARHQYQDLLIEELGQGPVEGCRRTGARPAWWLGWRTTRVRRAVRGWCARYDLCRPGRPPGLRELPLAAAGGGSGRRGYAERQGGRNLRAQASGGARGWVPHRRGTSGGPRLPAERWQPAGAGGGGRAS